MFDLLIYNTSSIITFRGPYVRGKNLAKPIIIEKGAIGCRNGRIEFIGKEDSLEDKTAAISIDAENKLVTPALVDPHTHIIFAGTRSDEFLLMLKGLTYTEIKASGGGIIKTVENTRKASKTELLQRARFFLKQFVSNGTLTIEAKSGYGLNLYDEIKILEITKELKNPVEIVSTFLGAHAVPPEISLPEYTEFIINVILPEIAKRRLARFCDVFVERGFFGVNEARKIMERAKELGFELKLHTNQFSDIGGVELGLELGCRSLDHLEILTDDEIMLLSSSNTAAVLLPGFSFFSNYSYSPARKLIENNVIVALGTDFNPGSSPTPSLPLIISIACVNMKMLPLEALAATTINAAYSIGMENSTGSLEIGKNADIIIWETNSLNDIPYFFGANLVGKVIKKGEIVKG